MDSTAIGRRIREARLSRGMTQEQLAEKAGISVTYISNLERGSQTASLDVFVPLCNALDVSSDALLQDVVNAAVLSQASELADLLRDQPQDVQRTALRVIRAVINKD